MLFSLPRGGIKQSMPSPQDATTRKTEEASVFQVQKKHERSKMASVDGSSDGAGRETLPSKAPKYRPSKKDFTQQLVLMSCRCQCFVPKSNVSRFSHRHSIVEKVMFLERAAQEHVLADEATESQQLFVAKEERLRDWRSPSSEPKSTLSPNPAGVLFPRTTISAIPDELALLDSFATNMACTSTHK